MFSTGWPQTGGRSILAHLPPENLEFRIAWADRGDLIVRALRIARERASQLGANAIGINSPLDVEVIGDTIACKLSVLCYLLETRSPEAEEAAEQKAAEAEAQYAQARAEAEERAAREAQYAQSPAGPWCWWWG